MQSTGQTGTHLPQPEHSSGMMITSMPWLKMAPNWSGQWRMQVSQLMHSAISMRKAGSFHFEFRSRNSMRSSRVAAGTLRMVAAGIPPVACRQPEDETEESVAKYPFLSEEWIAE